MYFDVANALPNGTEVFVGITLMVVDGEFKQLKAFAKVQQMGKAKTKPKVTVKEAEKLQENKTLAEDFNKIELKEEEF